MAATFLFVVMLIADKTRLKAVMGLLVVLTGVPVYWVWLRRRIK